jgi:replicative DNA helicase
MSPGQLIVLAARPAMGKSALAMNFALNCCKLTDMPVAVFSLEMLKSELSMRLLSMESKVESQRLKMKNLEEQDHHNISRAIKDLSQLPLFISDSGAITVPDIHSMCRKIKAEQQLGLIIIDYLQLLTPTNKQAPREQQISEMSRNLKEMAKELQCPVIALSQLNRGVEARTDKRPMMSDLRESGAIEQDADIIMMIYRDEYYNPESTKEPGVAEVIVGKNRGGEIGTAKMAFVGAYTSFENLAYEPQN